VVTDVKRLGHATSDLSEVEVLLHQAFPDAHHLDHAYFRWSYIENPDGHALGFNAYHHGTLAAHYVTQPLRALVEGNEERGLLSFHTATHPDYQGQGLFTQLARRTFDEARSEGFDFVVGVANAASTPGFIRKLGFQLVAPLDVRVGLGPPRFRPPPANSTPCFSRIWSAEGLSWRCACPARRYGVVPDGERTTLYSPTGRGGILAELGSFPSDQVPEHLPRAGSLNPLRLWMGLEPGQRTGAYFPLPDPLRLSTRNLIFLDLTGAKRQLAPHRVRFQAIDFDAY
jgi:GNAT superfamily N-acetyltransferase